MGTHFLAGLFLMKSKEISLTGSNFYLESWQICQKNETVQHQVAERLSPLLIKPMICAAS